MKDDGWNLPNGDRFHPDGFETLPPMYRKQEEFRWADDDDAVPEGDPDIWHTEH
jgi:hypothetical protein